MTNPTCVFIPVSRAFVEVGANVARGHVIGRAGALVHASISGRVTSIAPRARFADELQPALHIGIEAQRETPADEFLEPLSEPGSDAIIQRCEDAGLVGLGGGGFPTGDKLRAASGRVHCLVVNLMESDAGIGADAYLARTSLALITRGAKLAASACGCENILIAAPSELAAEIAGKTHITVSSPHVSEPAGEERRLLKGLFAADIEQAANPIDAGYIVLNGATCAAIAQAVDDGRPVIDRLVCVGSDVQRLPIGTLISELVSMDNDVWRSGAHLSGERLHRLACIGKTSYAISRDDRARQAPCIRCGLCRDVCPEPLLPDELIWWRQDNERMTALSVDRCLECGLCDSVCPSDIPMTDLIRAGKKQLRAERDKQRAAALSLARVEARTIRLNERALIEETRREARLARLANRRGANAIKPASNES